ncbi:uncharacterized protein LOC129906788 isoform X2 [Episyrphus balteatus]|uniref:uncharacterized protein LOC129906788 isoform X2 n=1 Tax=Episyrphus balteatus TaxID=286459 RepID=UPI002486ACE9|nr:uncharacterized protein LOC129906788 isoform X2 [Episyrphus balteatus]
MFNTMKDDPDTNVHFVRTIECYPCLYNRQCKEYSNKTKQDETWKEIAKNFDATVFECKERWKNLRACYSRHLKLKNISVTTGSQKKPYYLAEHLDFLKPFTKSRNQIGNPYKLLPRPFILKNDPHEKEDLEENFSENDQDQDNNESTMMTDEVNETKDSFDTNVNQSNQQRLLTSYTSNPSVQNKRRWTEFPDEDRSFNKKQTIEPEEDFDLCFFKMAILNEKVTTSSDCQSSRQKNRNAEESRPNSRLSTLSSSSSIQFQYKVKEENIEQE